MSGFPQFSRSPLSLFWNRFKIQLHDFITSKSALNRLLMLNVIVYLGLLITKLFLHLLSFLMVKDYTFVIYNWLAFPAAPDQLLIRPWTLLTSLFVHASFGHLFWNMVILYVAGKIFLYHLNDNQLWSTYLVGGLVGNLIFMLAYNTFPVFQNSVGEATCIGASGAIMAVLFAISLFRPNQSIGLWLIGNVKLIWVALFFVIIDLIQLPSGNAGGHFAHLGGAFYGTFFALGKRFLPQFKTIVFEKSKKQKYASSHSDRPLSDAEFNERKKKQADRVDLILDKISKNGYDVLTQEEKDFLYNYKR